MKLSTKIGQVVRVRVNPKDCMACVDVARQAGYDPGPMSFSQVVSITVGIVLESLRQNKIIPDRDGFEYADIMRYWQVDVKADRARKLGITKSMQLMDRSVLKAVALDPELGRKKLRFDELAFKANHDEANMDEVEKIELQSLIQELMPL